jgi:hypothetical protein
MPAPLPLPVRQALWQRFLRGQSPTTIAQALGLAPRTVRHLLRRLRDGGPDALAPTYRSPQVPPDPMTQQLHDQTIAWRREHPQWGSGLLRVFLLRDFPQATIPCTRTLQRWLEQAGLGPAPSGRRPSLDTPRAGHPHEVWQVDAAEQVRLRSGQRVSWLRMVDECSGAVLATAVFPPREMVDRSTRRGPRAAASRFCPLGKARHRTGGTTAVRGAPPATCHRTWPCG